MTVTTLLDFAALMFLAAALMGWLNARTLKLPHTIGIVVASIAASLLILLLDAAVPGLGLQDTGRALIGDIDVSGLILDGMLAFLLFAGALTVNLDDLLSRKWSVLALATVGVAISTVVIGGAMYGVFALAGAPVPFMWCLVFGALISPTDPVAVLAILRQLGLPEGLVTEITGESLFNDGVAIVLFAVLVEIAVGGGAEAHALGLTDSLLLFGQEAGGGLLLGVLGGVLAFAMLKSVDHYETEILVTLALVSGLTTVAHTFHVSAPLAVVIAGLLVGNHGARFAMSQRTLDHLFPFWTLVDEVLNSLLFVLIGFEVLALTLDMSWLMAAVLAIPVSLAARAISLSIPFYGFGLARGRPRGAAPVMIWGGLHGAISVALVLSLPPSPWKQELLVACYSVVLFSIIVQGLTLERVARFFSRA